MSKTKFTVEMPELRRKVNFVRNGLGSSKTDLAVTMFRFEVNGNKATIFAACKELFCRTEMKIAREPEASDGTFSVLGSRIVQLISQVEAEKATFAADPENLEVQVGFLTVNFELYDGAVLKTVENGVQDHLRQEGLTVDRTALEEALSCAKTCTTTNSIRPDLNHVELRQGRALSSDGRKIMIYSHDGFPTDAKIKVPAAILPSVVTAIKNVDAEKIQIFEGDAYFFLKANLNEFSMGVRKVERTFPSVEHQIKTQATATDEVAIDRLVFESILKGVALGLPSEEVKVTIDVGGTGSEAYLEVSALNALGRRSHERASCGRKATDKISFPLSFKHVLDTLTVFKGDSVVDVMVHKNLNLMMVRDTTDAREVLTLIPFRTDAAIDAEKKEAEAAVEARKKQQEEDRAEAGAGAETAAAATADIELED